MFTLKKYYSIKFIIYFSYKELSYSSKTKQFGYFNYIFKHQINRSFKPV